MKKIIGLIVILFILIAGTAGIGYYYFLIRPNTSVADDGIIYIYPEDSFEKVVSILQSKEYLKNVYTLRKVAEAKKYPILVKSGRFRIQNNMTNNELVNLLRAGVQEPIHFTFNNIRTFPEFAGILARQLTIDSLAFMQLATDPSYTAKWGFTPSTFIGMFIPNTYEIYWDTSLEDWMKRMNTEYRKFWNEDRIGKAKKANLSPMDMIIIASIIEEETVITAEYPIIAGVYINRLKKGWNLGACPTLKFALGDFSLKRILDKHIEVESPYNTYKNPGLPPGPIRMPSIQVIDAVLNYQHHNYMFFCAKSDLSGRHHFSRTLQEHNRHAAAYHQALNRMKIY